MCGARTQSKEKEAADKAAAEEAAKKEEINKKREENIAKKQGGKAKVSTRGAGTLPSIAHGTGCEPPKPLSLGTPSAMLTAWYLHLCALRALSSRASRRIPILRSNSPRAQNSSKYSKKDVFELKAVFDEYDKDRSGRISVDEFASSLKVRVCEAGWPWGWIAAIAGCDAGCDVGCCYAGGCYALAACRDRPSSRQLTSERTRIRVRTRGDSPHVVRAQARCTLTLHAAAV